MLGDYINKAIFLYCMAMVVTSKPVHAAGFDKPNLVSGKHTGISGASTSSVEGPESVFFNPAGLAHTQHTQWSTNLALGLPFASAPLVPIAPGSADGRDPISSKFTTVPVLGLFGAYAIRNNLGFGLGLFASGGAGGDFGNVDFGPDFPSLKPEFNSKVGLIEASPGIGYEPINGLLIGAAWRIMVVRLQSRTGLILPPGSFGAPNSAFSLLSIQFNDATGTEFNGFRFGVQYSSPSRHWGLGASVRTTVDFSAHGTSSGAIENSGATAVGQLTGGGEATLSSTFPLQAAFGVHGDISSTARLHGEYSYTRNTAIAGLQAGGAPLVLPDGTQVPISAFSTAFHWKNQQQLRVGAQWRANEKWVLRGGYSHCSQVVPNEYPSPFINPPSPEQVFTLGAGTRVFHDSTQMDVAFEIDSFSGKGQDALSPLLNGDYKFTSFGIFVGFSQ